jgi:hypothetical protein
MARPEFKFIVMTSCPVHGRTTVYEGYDEREARTAYRKVLRILNEIEGCEGERVQMWRSPFRGELVCENVEQFSASHLMSPPDRGESR